MAAHTHMLTGLDSDKAMLDIFFSGFMSGAGSIYKTVAIEGLGWSSDDAARFAEEQARQMTKHAADDPLLREEALRAVRSVLRCHAGHCPHHDVAADGKD